MMNTEELRAALESAEAAAVDACVRFLADRGWVAFPAPEAKLLMSPADATIFQREIDDEAAAVAAKEVRP